MRVFGLVCTVASVVQAGEQASAPTTPASAAPVLTLGSPMIRSTMDRVNMSWLFPEKVPDFRLKIERPTWGPLSQAELDSRLRGVEFQLPVEGVWVGYETSADGQEPRATFSIQRGF